MKTARWLVPGLVSQYDPQVKIGILFVLGAIIGGVLYTLVRFLKRHGDEPLSTRHAVRLLGFWAIVELVLFPNLQEDFNYYHRWKVITHNFPLSEWYEIRAYNIDYAPLFAYLEWLEGSLLALFFPDDLKLSSMHRESNGFRVAMGVMNVVVHSSYWFALLKLFRTLQARMKKRVTVNLFSFCFISSNLLFVDGARNQANQLILALTVVSMAYILEQRYLMSAFWYCLALNSKQLTLYYSLAYFLYLLIVYGLTPSFNFKNLVKLGSLVIVFHTLLYLPFVSSFHSMLLLLSGSQQNAF